MSDERVPAAVRRLVQARANYLCEYCRTPQVCGQGFYSVEHVRPRVAGAIMIRRTRGAAFSVVDPLSGESVPLFHPRRDRWEAHFAWDTTFTRLVGLTAVGRATVVRLRLNRVGLVNMRRLIQVSNEQS